VNYPEADIYFAAYVLASAGGAEGNTLEAVAIANRTPVAEADFTVVGNTINLTGSTSFDLDGDALSYQWELESPQETVTFASATSADTSVTGFTGGQQYTFKLTATDSVGLSDSVTVMKYVNAAPVADAGLDQTLVKGVTSLNGSASRDSDGSIVSYQWSLVSGNSVGFTNANAVSTDVSGLTAGETYVFQLTVTDDDGLSATDLVSVQTAEPTAYEEWAAQYYPGESNEEMVGFGSDPYGVGYSNGVAFLTVSDPSYFDTNVRSLMTMSDDMLSYSMRRNGAATTAFLEYSYDLNEWFTLTNETPGVTITVTPNGYGEGVDKIEVDIDTSIHDECFVRQGITAPE